MTKPLQDSLDATLKAEVKQSASPHSETVSVSEVSLMSVRAKVAPSWDSLIDVARPMPDPEPVMRMILSLNEGAMTTPLLLRNE